MYLFAFISHCGIQAPPLSLAVDLNRLAVVLAVSGKNQVVDIALVTDHAAVYFPGHLFTIFLFGSGLSIHVLSLYVNPYFYEIFINLQAFESFNSFHTVSTSFLH